VILVQVLHWMVDTTVLFMEETVVAEAKAESGWEQIKTTTGGETCAFQDK